MLLCNHFPNKRFTMQCQVLLKCLQDKRQILDSHLGALRCGILSVVKVNHVLAHIAPAADGGSDWRWDSGVLSAFLSQTILATTRRVVPCINFPLISSITAQNLVVVCKTVGDMWDVKDIFGGQARGPAPWCACRSRYTPLPYRC